MERIFRRGSTQEDVHALFALPTDAVRYLHRSYEADFGRADWLDAFLRNVEGARYQEHPRFCMAVTKVIPGNGSVAVEYVYGRATGGTCLPAEDAKKLVMFELSEGKIRRIEEMW